MYAARDVTTEYRRLWASAVTAAAASLDSGADVEADTGERGEEVEEEEFIAFVALGTGRVWNDTRDAVIVSANASTLPDARLVARLFESCAVAFAVDAAGSV